MLNSFSPNMEKPSKPRTISKKTDANHGLSHLGSDHSTFPSPIGPDSENSDTEMIQIRPVTYTSLKDLLPFSSSSPSSSCFLSPKQKSSSWQEISIKNPLVQHAARAYLQPLSTPTDVANKGFLGRMKDQCGCIGWLNDLVLKPLRIRCFEIMEEISDDDDDDGEDFLR